MCGIYGGIGDVDGRVERIRSMHALLEHRGPDDRGFTLVERGALGHARLSIIDPVPESAQPMWDPTRSACIVYNGEIYNYRELREECRRAGLGFATASDTEVILNQYLLHGAAAFDRLDGIFALCLHDAREGAFFLVRDPMGVKPLYWADDGRSVLFASELKALVGSGLVPAEVDPAALQAYLQLDFVPAPLCMVCGVRKLREGHLLEVRRDGARPPRRYSSLPGRPPRRTVTLEEASRELGGLLRDAVAHQLVSDVPLGVFVSGGIDSALVAQAASEVSGRRIASFSIGFDDPSFDETRWSSAVASRLGTEHHHETVAARSMLELVPRMARVACEPLADGSILPTYVLCRFARGQVKVVLSGDGADELFAGYPTYVAAARLPSWPQLGPRAGRRLARAAHALLPVSHANFSFDFKVKKLLEGLHPDPILRNARWLGSFTAEELPGLLLQYDPGHQAALEAMLHEPAEEAGDVSLLEKLLRTDQRFYMQDGVLVKVDRASMASALEVRVPWLAPSIVAFARALDPEHKLAGREGKRVLRALARGRIPDGVIDRPKKGFGAPLGAWFRGELRDLLHDTLSPARLARHGFLRGAAVAGLLEEHASGRRDHRKRLFNLLTFVSWLDTLGERAR
jgi:asparagine synthase (glutamine-hydrolysing)